MPQHSDVFSPNALGLPSVDDIISVYAVLSLQDYYNKSMTWRDIACDGLQAYIQKNGFWGDGVEVSSDVNYWGIALFYSYRAYNDTQLLDIAENAWSVTYSNAFITPGDAASGSGAGRNVSFLPPSDCAGGTALVLLLVNATC